MIFGYKPNINYLVKPNIKLFGCKFQPCLLLAHSSYSLLVFYYISSIRIVCTNTLYYVRNISITFGVTKVEFFNSPNSLIIHLGPFAHWWIIRENILYIQLLSITKRIHNMSSLILIKLFEKPSL